MKITLLKAFPDDYRRSMKIYEQNLRGALRDVILPEDQVDGFLPSGIMTSPKAARYFSQYVWYPLASALQKSDIFHITDHSYAHLALSLPKGKTVVTFHDAIWLKTRRGRYNEKNKNISWVKKLNLRALAKAEAVICDSNASRQALLENTDYPGQKTHVIYPGCEPLQISKTKEEARALLGINPGLYVLHVGHSQGYKNISGLIWTLSILRKQIPEIRLLKVGTAFDREHADLIDQLNLNGSVFHLGLLDFDRLKLAYRAADILLIPSFDEGFGFPLLEAMSLDLPVVASNRGSLPEVVGDAGLMASPEDFDGLARHVEKLLSDRPLREKMISAGRIQSKKFQWNSAAAEVYSVYKKVLYKS